MPEILIALLLAAAGGDAPAETNGGGKHLATATAEKSADNSPEKLKEHPSLPPEITTDGLRDELKRAARERKLQAAKMNDERAKLTDERTQLEQMAKDIEEARKSLRSETQDFRQKGKRRPAPSDMAQAAGESPVGAKPSPSPLDLVAKTLKNMKPDQAAQVLIHVERSLAVEVLARMRPSDAGAVLEKMKPEQAAQFIAALAGEGRGGGQEQRHE